MLLLYFWFAHILFGFWWSSCLALFCSNEAASTNHWTTEGIFNRHYFRIITRLEVSIFKIGQNGIVPKIVGSYYWWLLLRSSLVPQPLQNLLPLHKWHREYYLCCSKRAQCNLLLSSPPDSVQVRGWMYCLPGGKCSAGQNHLGVLGPAHVFVWGRWKYTYEVCTGVTRSFITVLTLIAKLSVKINMNPNMPAP